jgi:4-methylaminobutanoate oxidase (formaldehyde-forming)
MGYVKCPHGITSKFIQEGRYEINVSGKRLPATPHLKAPYDPERKRILA